MPSFKDIDLQTPFKGQNMSNADVQGPKVPNFKKLLPEMRKEGLFGTRPDRLEMRNKGSMNGLVPHEAVNVNNRSGQQPKTYLAECGNTKDQGRRDKQGSAIEHHGALSKVADIHSDKFIFGRPGLERMDKVRRDYKCNRASGLSAGLQYQRPTGSEDYTDTEVCCVCLEAYSWKDQKVITPCCEIAIGSHCKAHHLAEFGECWNCGEEEIQNKAASEAGSWVSYDLKDFVTEAPPLPLYVSLLPSNDARREPAIAKAKAGSVLPSGSTIGGQSSNTPSSKTRVSDLSQTTQPLFVGLTEEQCDREAVVYQSRSGKESSTRELATTQSSRNLDDGYTKSYAAIDEPKITPSESQSFLHNGSDSLSSDLSQEDQHHVRSLTLESQKRQEAKQYVIGALKHLLEVCDAYDDVIDDEIKSEIVEAVGGCKTFQAAIDQQIFKSASARTTQQVSAQSPATVDVSNLKLGEGETYCGKCEELGFRMKKAADALLGV